jgi:hypothetical protein
MSDLKLELSLLTEPPAASPSGDLAMTLMMAADTYAKEHPNLNNKMVLLQAAGHILRYCIETTLPTHLQYVTIDMISNDLKILLVAQQKESIN